MPELDIDELERLAKAATPGPWRVESEVCRDSMGLFWPISSIEGAEDNVTENVTTGDAAYIVAACNSLPALIAELKEARAEGGELKRHSEWLERKLQLRIDNNAALIKRLREQEGRIAELTTENSNQKRVIQMLEYRVLELKGETYTDGAAPANV